MSMPKWLAQEVDDLARRVKSGELDREEAISTVTEHALKKDEDYVRVQMLAHFSGKIDNAVKRIKDSEVRQAEKELSRIVSGEATFDDIASDYWPRDTFGPRDPLEILGAHSDEMMGLAERHMERCQARQKRYEELVAAAQGNLADGLGRRRTSAPRH